MQHLEIFVIFVIQKVGRDDTILSIFAIAVRTENVKLYTDVWEAMGDQSRPDSNVQMQCVLDPQQVCDAYAFLCIFV